MKAVLRSVLVVFVMGFVGRAVAAPGWCSGFDKKSSNAHGDLKELQERDDPRWVVPALVDASCGPDQDQQRQQPQIAKAREAWSQKLDMTDADWAEAVGYAMLDRYAEELHFKNTKKAWSAFDAIDQYLALTDTYASSGDISHDKNYLADALGGRLTALGRAGYVKQCVVNDDEHVVQWAMCAPDIAQLDWKRAAADLRATKAYEGADKMRIRLALLALKTRIAEHAVAVKKVLAKDPAYIKIFQLAEKTRKDWDKGGVADAAVLEVAMAMDDARALNSRSGFQGCEDKTFAAWRKAVAKIPAKQWEGVRDDRENGKSFLDGAMAPLINDANTYLASVAHTICMGVGQDKKTQPDLLVRELGSALMRWPGYRGPRSAAQTAVMAAGIELDDRDARLDYPDVSRSFGAYGGSHGGGGTGVVATVKSAGEKATVTFKKQSIKESRCTQSKMTNRISQITSNGTVIYYHNCLKYGVVTVDKTSGDQTVSTKYTEGVKPGVQFTNIEDVVLATWAKPGASVPSTVFGVPVK